MWFALREIWIRIDAITRVVLLSGNKCLFPAPNEFIHKQKETMMKRLSTGQLKYISGGAHWIPNGHGGFSAPGTHALRSIASGNGGKIPTEITSDGLVLLGTIIGGSIGMMFAPCGLAVAVGAMIGQVTNIWGLGVKKTGDNAKH